MPFLPHPGYQNIRFADEKKRYGETVPQAELERDVDHRRHGWYYLCCCSYYHIHVPPPSPDNNDDEVKMFGEEKMRKCVVAVVFDCREHDDEENWRVVVAVGDLKCYMMMQWIPNDQPQEW